MKTTNIWPNDMFAQEDAEHSKTIGVIQWKGTEVCMDVHCECGHYAHIDCEFLYFYQCPKCLRKFAVGCTVQMYLLEGAAAEYEEKNQRALRPDLCADDNTVLVEGNLGDGINRRSK